MNSILGKYGEANPTWEPCEVVKTIMTAMSGAAARTWDLRKNKDNKYYKRKRLRIRRRLKKDHYTERKRVIKCISRGKEYKSNHVILWIVEKLNTHIERC